MTLINTQLPLLGSSPPESSHRLVLVQGIHLLGVLVHQRLGLGILDVDGEAVIVVLAVGVAGVAVLPVHAASQLLSHHGLLPAALDLDSGPIIGHAGVFQTLVRSQPAVLLVHDRLVGGAAGGGVVTNPLVGPFNSLAPPVWIRVEGAKIDGGEADLVVEIAAVGTIVGPVVGHAVELALAAPGNEMIAVERLDVRTHLGNPGRKNLRAAVGAARQVAHAVGAAAGLVGQLPSEDGRRVLVAGHDLLDIALECVLDLRDRVELDLSAGATAEIQAIYELTSSWYWPPRLTV